MRRAAAGNRQRIAVSATTAAVAIFLLTRPGDSWDFHWVYKGVVAFLHHEPAYATSRPIDCIPSALLIWSPTGLLDEFTATVLMRVIATGSVIAVMWLSLALVWERQPPARWLIPAIAALTIFDPARAVLRVANVGVVSVLLVTIALWFAARHQWMAFALLLGLGLAIKPVAAALVLMPLLERRVRPTLLAIAIPCGLSAVALALSDRPSQFFTDKVPLLLHGFREFTWSYGSINGVLGGLDVPSAIITVLRVVVGGGLVIVAVRRYRSGGPNGLRIAEVAGCLVMGTLLSATFSLNHYILFLLPMLAGFTLRQSGLRTLAGGVGLVLVTAPYRWSFAVDLHPRAVTLLWSTGLCLLAASMMWRSYRKGPDEGGWARDASAPRAATALAGR